MSLVEKMGDTLEIEFKRQILNKSIHGSRGHSRKQSLVRIFTKMTVKLKALVNCSQKEALFYPQCVMKLGRVLGSSDFIFAMGFFYANFIVKLVQLDIYNPVNRNPIHFYVMYLCVIFTPSCPITSTYLDRQPPLSHEIYSSRRIVFCF